MTKGSIIAIKEGVWVFAPDVTKNTNVRYFLPKGVRGYFTSKISSGLSVKFTHEISFGICKRIIHIDGVTYEDKFPVNFEIQLTIDARNVLLVKKPRVEKSIYVDSIFDKDSAMRRAFDEMRKKSINAMRTFTYPYPQSVFGTDTVRTDSQVSQLMYANNPAQVEPVAIDIDAKSNHLSDAMAYGMKVNPIIWAEKPDLPFVIAPELDSKL